MHPHSLWLRISAIIFLQRSRHSRIIYKVPIYRPWICLLPLTDLLANVHLVSLLLHLTVLLYKNLLVYCKPKSCVLDPIPTGSTIRPKPAVCNLGVTMDKHLQLTKHINNISKSAFFAIRNIGRIRKHLDRENCEYMTLAFSKIFSTCHLSSCHVFERSYKWLTTNIFAFKLEGYTYNIHADYTEYFQSDYPTEQPKHFNFFSLLDLNELTVFFDRKKDYQLRVRLSFGDLTVKLMNISTQKYHVNIIFLIRNLFLLRNVIVSLIKQLIRYLPFLSVHTEKIFSLVLNDKTSENIFLVWTSKPLNNIY